MANPPKRPGTMSDEERALAALERRRLERERREAPAFGMPIHVPADEDFTPIGHVFERLAATMPGFELTERERQLLQVVWIHTANIELRSRQRLADSDCGQLAADFAEHREEFVQFKTDLTGASGNNGKFSILRKEVEEVRKRAEAAPTFVKRTLVAAGTGILGALIPAALYVRSAAEDAAKARAEAAAERATVRARLDASDADRAQLHEQLNALFRSARVRALNPQGDNSP